MSDSSTPAHSDPSAPTATTSKKRRLTPRRLAIAAALLTVILIIVNGPVARYAVDKLVTDSLAAEGLAGRADISGSLISGFRIENAAFAGEDRIQKLSFDLAEVAYSPGRLLRKQVDLASAKNIEVAIDLRKPSPRERELKVPNAPPLAEQLRQLRPLALPIEIDVEDVAAEVILPDGRAISATLGAITHAPGSDRYLIQGLQVTHTTAGATPKQDATLQWTEGELSLDQLTILPEIGIEALTLAYLSDNAIGVKGDIILPGARLRAESPSPTTVSVSIAEGAIDLERMATMFLEKAPIRGSIDTLDLSVSDLDRPLYEVNADFAMNGETIRLGFLPLKTLKIRAYIEGTTLIIDTQLGRSESTITFPLAEIQSLDDLKDFSQRDLAFTFQSPSLRELLGDSVPLVAPDQLSELPDGAVAISGSASITGSTGLLSVAANYALTEATLRNEALPNLSGEVSYAPESKTVHSTAVASDGPRSLRADVFVNLLEEKYSLSLGGDLPASPAIQSQMQQFTGLTFAKPPKLALKSQGSLSTPTHRAQLVLTDALVEDRARQKYLINTKATADWPTSIEISSFKMTTDAGTIAARGKWAEDTVVIDELSAQVDGQNLLSINGTAPLPLDLHDLTELPSTAGKLDLAVKANELTLDHLRRILPFETNGRAGKIDADFTINGTYATPTINGHLAGTGWQDPAIEGLRPIDFSLTANTKNTTLSVDGHIDEGGERVAAFDGAFPLEIESWLKGEETVAKTPITAHFRATDLALERFRRVYPGIDRMVGKADLDLTVSGTASSPQLDGSATIAIERLRLDNENVPDLRESQLNLGFDGSVITIRPSRFTGSGGVFDLSGKYDISGSGAFDIAVVADKALVYRDDSLNLRTDARLRLFGTPDAAQITGSLNIAESLYYRDIEIIPSGIPAKSVPTPSLPRVDSTSATSGKLPIPAPFADWTLDVSLATTDPLLIRGNLAEGAITATGRASGSLADPQVTLDAEIRQGQLELPLSRLTIKSGRATLRPGRGLIPRLDIRGESLVGGHTAFVYVYGPADAPQIALTADPPLPEPDVLALLATGSTPSTLADVGTARSKAFQLFISEWRKKLSAPGRSELAQATADALGNLELSSGSVDTLSGRSFTSAKLKLSDRVSLYAGFDDRANSRALVIYSLRSGR